MPARLRPCPPAYVLVLAACSAPSVDPEEMASQLPPERQLDETTTGTLEDLTRDALRLLNEGHFPEAEAEARRALGLQPRQARPRAVLGTCLMYRAQEDEPPDLRLWRQAEGELLSATRTDPDDPVVAVLYGQFLVQDGHLTAAAQVAETALARNPGDLPALRLAAQTRYELGEERLARPHLVQLAEVDSDPQIRYRLAWCVLRLADGELEERVPLLLEAADAFAVYRAMEPGDMEGYLAEGRALVRAAEETEDSDQRSARSERAVVVYDLAVDRFPDRAAPRFGRAVCLELLGRTEAATEAYEQTLERDPRHVGALLNLAAQYAAAGEREPAETLYRRALREDLTSEERAQVLEYLGGGLMPP